MLDTAAAAASEAIRAVAEEPAKARRLALLTRARARRSGDRAAESIAERAIGLAARELKDFPAAARHLRAAVRVAELDGLAVRAAEARMSLSLVLAERGATREALREAARASRELRGLEAARMQTQLALILQRLGRVEEALEGYRRALPVFRREADLLWEARLVNNRGVLEAYRGNIRAAESDLTRAEQIYVRLGMRHAAADTRWNLGFAAARGGDMPAALARYTAAERYYVEHGIPRPALLQDRCELLLSAGLFTEALAAAEQAVRELDRMRTHSDLAEARLMLAQAALATGDPATGLRAARLAGRAFTRQDRPGWAVLARYTALRAAWHGGVRGRAALRAARGGAAELAAAGWVAPAMDARLIAARIALDLGEVSTARAELRQAVRARTRGPVELRVRAWYAEALLRLAAGDPRGADAALRAGLRALHDHRETLGATELRARASAHGEEIAMLGLSLAVAGGRAGRVLTWAERCRSRALEPRPIRPPRDPTLAAELAELRSVVHEREQALLAGRDAGRLLRRQAALERSIRERTRSMPAGSPDRRVGVAAASPLAVRTLAAALDKRALIELIELDGRLLAVVLADGRARLRRLGDRKGVTDELAALRFSLRRLAAGRGTPAALAAARLGVTEGSARLDARLLAPLRDDIGERELVIVPTGALHTVPWSLLPTCVGRPVSVAPSAKLWLTAVTAPKLVGPARDKVVLVAGPGLPGADAEVAALAERYGPVSCLMSGAARVSEVMSALDGANLAHVAAHGTFRGDNPLFSALTLADGPLTVCDLEALDRAPRLVVLSACDSGVSSIHTGDELIGLAAALFSLGTQTLVASVVPVPDASTRRLMLTMHRALQDGVAPSAALAQAQAAAGRDDDAALAAAAGFVCFGAG